MLEAGADGVGGGGLDAAVGVLEMRPQEAQAVLLQERFEGLLVGSTSPQRACHVQQQLVRRPSEELDERGDAPAPQEDRAAVRVAGRLAEAPHHARQHLRRGNTRRLQRKVSFACETTEEQVPLLLSRY